MDAFVRKFCEKYSLPITVSLQLLEKMEKFSFRKGDFLVQEGERNSNFYIISKGIWRGHYLNDGADVSVWFASEGEAVFSSWGYIENTPSLVSIEAMCETVNFMVFLRQNWSLFMLHLLNWPTSEEGFSNSNFSVWRIGLSAEGVLVPKSVILLCWKRIPNFCNMFR